MVTVHVWQSTTADIERPDFLLVDLDPSEQCTLAQLARATLLVRDFLHDLGAGEPLVKSSGARGLHLFLNIEPEYDYKTVRALSRSLALQLAHRHPKQFTVEREPAMRAPGTVYVDWGQVGRGMSIVPPFSPRACEGAPVSMPLSWDEIEGCARSRSKRPPMKYFKRYNLGSAVEMLKRSGDPWTSRRRSSLTPLIEAWSFTYGSGR